MTIVNVNRREPKLDAKIWYTIDVAAYLDVTYNTVYTYLSRGRMPAKDAIRHGRHGWRPATIVAWQEERIRDVNRARGRWSKYSPKGGVSDQGGANEH